VTRSLIPLGLDTISMLPQPCRSCIRWEIGPQRSGSVASAGQAEFEKEVWLSGVMLTWGSCGQLALVDDDVAGYALFAPPSDVSTAANFPTAPVSPDAVLLMVVKIVPSFRGQGLARYLLQGVAKHLAGRGVRAIEMFAHRGERTSLPSDEAIPPCLVPAEFALAMGFTEIGPHHRYPRMRLDLDAALGWKADVEYALEQLFTVIRIPAGPVREVVAAGTGPQADPAP
jgi:GNAT superfamily N-acetyltransferase